MFLFQFLAGVVANLPGLSAGFSMGFSAILIPQLQQPGAEISATLEQGSWIGELLKLLYFVYCVILKAYNFSQFICDW